MNKLDYLPDGYLQESTSVYFNNIIRCDVSPVTAEELDRSCLEHFNRQIELVFADEADDATMRLRDVSQHRPRGGMQ